MLILKCRIVNLSKRQIKILGTYVTTQALLSKFRIIKQVYILGHAFSILSTFGFFSDWKKYFILFRSTTKVIFVYYKMLSRFLNNYICFYIRHIGFVHKINALYYTSKIVSPDQIL